MAKKKRTKKDQLLDVARQMPPLHHKLPYESFDWNKSAALKWLVSQPEILNYVWQSISNRSDADEFIVYDSETGMWQGVDYDDN